MELVLCPQPQEAIAAFLFVILLYILCKTHIWKKKGKSAPEPCAAWPLIGHLHLLKDANVPVCRILAAIVDRHGPVFSLRFGMKPALIISSWEAVKECYKTNDQVFLSRPYSAPNEYMGYKHALFGLAPYGPYWRDIRKMVIVKLLSNRQLELFKNVRASEVDNGVKNLYSLCIKNGSALVDMSQWFQNVVMNIVIRMVVGKRVAEGNDMESKRLGEAINKFMHLSGMFVISDLIPFMKWLDYLQGHVRSMKSTAEELDYFVSGWLKEHVEGTEAGEVKAENDFMDAMLSLLADKDSMYGHKREDIIKATVLNAIIAGADTTSVTLTWALALLLNHPGVQRLSQEELDNHVGRERWVDESDFENLPYLQAIVKETLRLYPPGSLSLPRESLADCYICGYYVPKGIRLVVNLWKLHRDPRIFPNPLEFQPERFLGCNAELDVRGRSFEYIPFSAGRRSCPGISTGMQMMCLILGRVVQGFNLSTPMNAPVDMREGLGLVMPKLTPLRVILTPRLPDFLYHQLVQADK